MSINSPYLVTGRNFQESWRNAIDFLLQNDYSYRNLIVHIEETDEFDQSIHEKVVRFTKSVGLKGPKDVAYTIFPENLYRYERNAQK